MDVGDDIEMSGPWGQIEYIAPGIFIDGKRQLPKKKNVGMLAGGTGLTPMLQVVQAVLSCADDSTVCSMIYANKNEEDILCREILDAYAAEHPNRFRIYYTLDNPPASGWDGGSGFVTQEMIEAHLPKPSEEAVVLMCGPPPMIKFACEQNLDKIGFRKENQLAF